MMDKIRREMKTGPTQKDSHEIEAILLLIEKNYDLIMEAKTIRK